MSVVRFSIGLGILYLGLVVATMVTKLPWIDEAWVANPVWNWLENGHFATSFFEKANPGALQTFSEHTYWMPPVWFVCEAGWFDIWGVGIFQQRALSALFGGVALVAVYFLTRQASGSKRCGIFATTLLAVDFVFLNHAADGRMDMMVAACTFSSYALYLNLREKSLGWAFFASNVAVALGGLTNPIGIIGALGLLYLILANDCKRITLRLLLVAAIPYLVGGVLWGVYILSDVVAFEHQFFGKTAAPDWSPVHAVYREIVERYLGVYGFTSDFKVGSLFQLSIAIIYSVCTLWVCAGSVLRWGRPFQIIGGLVLVEFFGMSILISVKSDYHMPQIVPLFAASLALLLYYMYKRGGLWRGSAMGVGIVMLFLQVRTDVKKIERNPYARAFLPALEAVRKSGDDGIVFAPPEFAFALRFPQWITYDLAYGFFSGKIPDVIVLRAPQAGSSHGVYPESQAQLEKLLQEKMQLVLENQSYLVYKRKD